MITLGFGLLLHEAANKAQLADGRHRRPAGRATSRRSSASSVSISRGYTGYAYALAVLFVACSLSARRIIHSPFGLSLRGIRENSTRMPAIGAANLAHIRKIYTISATIAGIAGAVLAQTTETVVAGGADFQRSADIVVILVLGGTGRLYGGLVGAIIFMVARDQFSGINPQLWYFWIGLLLVAVVMFLPNGVLGGLAQLRHRSGGRTS